MGLAVRTAVVLVFLVCSSTIAQLAKCFKSPIAVAPQSAERERWNAACGHGPPLRIAITAEFDALRCVRSWFEFAAPVNDGASPT